MAVNRFLAFSIGAHVLLGVALGAVRSEKRHETVAISFRDVKKTPAPSPPSTPPREDRAPPQPVPHASRAKTAPSEAKPAPVDPAPRAAPASDALPDFGLSLSGGGTGGVAVPVGRSLRSGPATPAPLAAKTLLRIAPKPDDCADAPPKPRPLTRSTPAYTNEARAAGVSGKVRVEITVDEQGRVVAARVIQGLGYGLDEAAIAAARAMTFEPAVRCGRPTRATFKIGFTFAPSSP